MRVVSGCRIALLGLLLLVAACGSANTEGPLQGRWFGPSLDGQGRALEIDGSGNVLSYSVNANPTGLYGWIKQTDGLYYVITWVEDVGGELEEIGTATFLLGTTGNHAAFYDIDGSVTALQRGATTWNPGGYFIEDIAPVFCTGDTWFLDNEGVPLGSARSQMDVFGDASYAGEDTDGRLFESPVGEVLGVDDGVRGIYYGLYMDQFRDSDADLTLLMTPDKLFVVAFANWDPWELVDGWVGVWELQDVAASAGP